MKKIVLFLMISILFTVVLLSVKNSYSAFTKNVQTSLEVTTPKLEAIFLPGNEFNTKIKQLAGDSGATSQTENTSIISIVRSNVLNVTPTVNNVVSTSDSSFPIYAWFSSGVLYYYTEVEHPYMNEDATIMFYNLTNLVNIDLSTINTSRTTSMRSMFNSDINLESLDLSNFDTSKVETMEGMFFSMQKLKNIVGIETFNTSNVLKTIRMFKNCNALENLNLESFDLGKVNDTTGMLDNLNSLKELKTPKVYPTDTSKIITLPKTMYDSNLVGYTSLGSSTTPTSPIQTLLKEGYIVTYDGNMNYNINNVSKTITYFENSVNQCIRFGDQLHPSDYNVGDNVLIEADISYTNLTVSDNQNYMSQFQTSGNITGWNAATYGNEFNKELIGTGSKKIYWIIPVTSLFKSNEVYNFEIRLDYYTGGSITISNIRYSKVEQKKYIYGDALWQIPTTSHNGYTLDGWYTEKSGGTKITTVSVPTSDITYYAHWLTALTNNKVNYSYTGSSQEFIAPQNGIYKVELWGAQGTSFDSTYQGGLGGYVSGNIVLSENEKLYIYVGEHKSDKSMEATFNGGGQGTDFADENGYQIGYSGGGATDIRLTNGSWNNFDSLKSRVMVAGAGGGTGAIHQPNKILDANVEYDQLGIAGSGGGLIGNSGNNAQPDSSNHGIHYASTGGTQTAGGHANTSNSGANSGGFGYGGYNAVLYGQLGGCGGGSGYYGAGGSTRGHGGAGGGSSFISGYSGSNAISSSSTSDNIIHTDQPNHYSGKVFTDGVMIDGDGCNWSSGSASNCGANQIQPDGSYAIGHSGSGYVRITLVTPGESWDFSYNGTDGSDGSVQTFTAPVSGTYKLETWGAQGGSGSEDLSLVEERGGLGGYSTGNIHLNANSQIYITIGGEGSQSSVLSLSYGGYNGGGNGGFDYPETYGAQGGSGGGGATHIANSLVGTGLLKDYSNNVSNILIVAGAGGGNAYTQSPNSHAGGYVGNDGGYNFDYPQYHATGGTQNQGGYDNAECTSNFAPFGQGGNFCKPVYGGNGGGGGFYGGGGSCRGHSGGGGGSSYIGNSNLTNKAMYCYDCTESLSNSTQEQKNIFTVSTTGSSAYKDVTNCPDGYSTSPVSKCAKAGNGYARITLISVN